MNNQTAYIRTKINWWIIVILAISYAPVITFINLWDSGSIGGLIIFIFVSLTTLPLFFILWRFQFIINNEYVIFRYGVWSWRKMPISMVQDVYVQDVSSWKIMEFSGKETKNHQFDFVNQAVIIHFSNNIVYKISIKNAQEIKDEIEKRMTK